jgi:putative flavoprotein involved in K+ transport
MAERISVVIIGAGPAGLATSHELVQAGVEHVVLERGRIGQSWRDRWDSFCLVTPNWSVQLPGGRILVVGSGQSGCQIAEELTDAGREVVLSCGRAPWTWRTIGGRDLVWWGIESGFVDQAVSDLPDPSARLTANILASGRRGGHDLHLRTLRAAGVTLVGHFRAAEDRDARFENDLSATVAWGDDRCRQFNDLIRNVVQERGLPVPDLPDPEPFDGRARDRIDLDGFGAVIFTGGFRPDYRRWVRVPNAFDELGFPIHVEGASVAAPGLFFVGVHFLRKRKSAVLFGMGEDAAVVAGQIAGR